MVGCFGFLKDIYFQLNIKRNYFVKQKPPLRTKAVYLFRVNYLPDLIRQGNLRKSTNAMLVLVFLFSKSFLTKGELRGECSGEWFKSSVHQLMDTSFKKEDLLRTKFPNII